MKDSKENFENMFKHWADRRGSAEDDRALLKAIAFEFFAFGHDLAVMRIHEQATQAARDIPLNLLDEEKRFQYGL